jgi:hypothetical protein
VDIILRVFMARNRSLVFPCGIASARDHEITSPEDHHANDAGILRAAEIIESDHYNFPSAGTDQKINEHGFSFFSALTQGIRENLPSSGIRPRGARWHQDSSRII